MCWRVRQRPVSRANPAFAQAAQRAKQRVAGAGIDVEVLSARGLLDRNVHADASAVVAGIGQAG
jgi:hypothetical protein